jgi:hypothetical protein
MAIWSILRPFGICFDDLVYIYYGYLVHISRFGILKPVKIWQPWHSSEKTGASLHEDSSVIQIYYPHSIKTREKSPSTNLPGANPTASEFTTTTPAL